ncbi:MAG: translation elongation factor Ts [Candidatus Liptonbacteria bacterium RIFCSPHIGHO2_01_FULL_57_28]|uniref:Elongation factor Ts n=1 Tax=Candidatus Liptonbacteria bacterium RIFCSPHIGHO2_01_FULL_57_28 TaxID=1798647 RepID=A0A1G2CAB0_9BACT|nr:MAG: translation elongation factor Ts [Candidatus Liptonbacteria bacterium RIFCSPHIGHO2_01_FULL_57_28]
MSNTEALQKLREETGAGLVTCKKAFDEAGGDLEKAIAILREKGMAKVEKTAGRSAGAGFIYSYVHNDRVGVLLDLRAETDFVVRSEPFKQLARELAMQIAAMGGETVEEVMDQDYIKDPSKKVSALVNDVIARVGEKVQIHRFSRLEV